MTVYKVAIPTRNRPKSLFRAAASVVADFETSGHPFELAVFDQSDPSLARENREQLERLARKSHGRLFYFGRKQREWLHESLKESGLNLWPRGLQSESRADTFGENRNFGRLFFAGEPYASLDDDVVVDWRALAAVDSFQQEREDNLRSFYAFETAEQLYANLRVEDSMGIWQWLQGSIQSHDDGMVHFAIPGIYGHSGLANHALLAGSESISSRLKMFASERAFKTLLISVHTIRQVMRESIQSAHSFVGTAYSCCNRTATVPYFSYGRGEDHLLFETLRKAGYEPQAVYLAHSLAHLPEHGRIPSVGIDILSLPSLISAVLRFGDNHHDLMGLARSLEEVAGSNVRWHEFSRAAFSRFANQQMQYCSDIACHSGVNVTAFSHLQQLVIHWSRLDAIATRGDSSFRHNERIMSARRLLLDYCEFARHWQDAWGWCCEQKDRLRKLSLVL